MGSQANEKGVSQMISFFLFVYKFYQFIFQTFSSSGYKEMVKVDRKGAFRYVFIVDGQWKLNDKQPVVQLNDGRECNIITIQ